ncbi:hypothetical protein GF322_02925 [Candidatus Dependentiae bacterium]|nr:hypothetical protein [Candidatus Dependentiae bacterium]
MNLLEKKDIFIRFICLITIFSVIIIWLYSYTTKKQKKIIKYENLSLIETYPAINLNVYNYNTMIKLVEEYLKLRTIFYTDYDNFIKNKLFLEKLKIILHELEKEKEYLYKYLRSTRMHNKSFVSSKKNKSLRYYYRIIDESIDDVIHMIEKFKLETKLQFDFKKQNYLNYVRFNNPVSFINFSTLFL